MFIHSLWCHIYRIHTQKVNGWNVALSVLHLIFLRLHPCDRPWVPVIFHFLTLLPPPVAFILSLIESLLLLSDTTS